MKNVILILVLTLLNINHANAQRKEGKIYFKDGKYKTGLVKLTKSGNVKYKSDKGSKSELFKKEILDRVIVTEKRKLREYAYKKIERSTNNISFVKSMQVLYKGEVSLYKIVNKVNNNKFGSPGVGFGVEQTMTNYYLGRKGSDLVKRISSSGTLIEKNFKKAVKKYFHDCPELIKRMDDRTYRKGDLWEIVKFYNESCI